MVSLSLILGFVAYLFALIVIGIYGWKKVKTPSDYIIGGRKIGFFIASMSEASTLWSGWALIGFPALIYSSGVRFWPWGPAAVLGNLVVWIFFAKRIARYTRILNSLTVPDFFEDRFRDSSHILRGLLSVTIELFMIFYLGANIMAGADAISGVFGLPYAYGFIIVLILVVFYTMVGGYFAVAYTDALQGILMMLFAIVVPIVGVIKAGGLDTIVSYANTVDPTFLSFTEGWTGGIGILAFISIWVNYGLLYAGQPHGIARYMSMRRPTNVHKGLMVSTVFTITMTLGGFFIALAGYVLIPGLEGKSVDFLAPKMVNMLFPEWLAGILLAGLVAAIMSTADSMLLVCSSTIAEDFYKKTLRPGATERSVVAISRLATIFTAAAGAVVAWFSPSIVHILSVFAWGALGATIAPPMMLALFWKKTTKWGVVAGMLTALITVMIWSTWVAPVTEINEALPAFALNLLVIIVVSLFTEAPKGVEKEIEALKAPLDEEEL